MTDEPSECRTRYYGRLAKAGLIGCLVAFATITVLLVLPVDVESIRYAAYAAVFFLFSSAALLVFAIAARDGPNWRKNRWRFSTGSLFSLMWSVSLCLGIIVAAERGVSTSRIILIFGGLALVVFIVNWIYIVRSRQKYFSAMNSQGRYSDWTTVAAHLAQGEGTVLLGQLNRVPTVWWTEREIDSLEDVQASVQSEAVVTICPQSRRMAEWLKSKFPTVRVVEMGTVAIRPDSAD